MWKCTTLFLLFIIFQVDCWKFFRHGRTSGGNLGKPHGEHFLDSNNVPEYWFTQKLDHFNPHNEETWKQRYFVNQQFADSTPKAAFLMIGGEGEASVEWMSAGAWIDYAKEYNALCFQLEHRYYGKSHPTANLSTENLQYLTSQQALADIATFIDGMNDKYKLRSNIKWIVFGGSYSGSLAAWVRQKYPHLVHGAVSSSAPLLAQVDFPEYLKVVADDLRSISDECVLAVKQGTAQVDILLRHMVGQRNLNKLFNLCDPIEERINNSYDVSNLFASLSDNFAGIAQYNKDNRIAKRKSNVTLDTLCTILTNQTMGPPVERLAKVNDLILSMSNETCLDYNYQKMINEMKNVSWDSEVSEGGRQWTYQTCTEFGFFQSSNYIPKIFGDKFGVEFFIQQCIDIFGPSYNASFLDDAADRTNIIYGALDIEVTNVVFVHGSVDPWHALGITTTRENDAPAIYVKGTAHCADVYPKSDNDLPELMAARVQIADHIGTWLDL